MPEDLLDENTPQGLLRNVHNHIGELLNTCLTFEQSEFVDQATTMLLQELQVHDILETELFNPFIRTILPQREVLFGNPPTRDVELSMSDDARLRELGERLTKTDPLSDSYRTTLADLSEAFVHHTYRQEGNVFPLLEMTDPNMHNMLVRLGGEMSIRRDEIIRSFRAAPRTVRASRQARAEHIEALETPPAATERPGESAHGS